MAKAARPKVRMTIYVDADIRRRAKVAASQADVSLSEFCNRLLERGLADATDMRARWDAALQRLDALRARIRERYGVHPDSVEMIRRMREERDKQLGRLS